MASKDSGRQTTARDQAERQTPTASSEIGTQKRTTPAATPSRKRTRPASTDPAKAQAAPAEAAKPVRRPARTRPSRSASSPQLEPPAPPQPSPSEADLLGEERAQRAVAEQAERASQVAAEAVRAQALDAGEPTTAGAESMAAAPGEAPATSKVEGVGTAGANGEITGAAGAGGFEPVPDEVETETHEATESLAGETDLLSIEPSASSPGSRRYRGAHGNALGALIERHFSDPASPCRSYSDLERRSGISREALSRYVTARVDRRRSPTIDTLVAIADAMHISLEAVCRAAAASVKGVMPPPDEIEYGREEVLGSLTAVLSDDQFSAVVELLRQMHPIGDGWTRRE